MTRQRLQLTSIVLTDLRRCKLPLFLLLAVVVSAIGVVYMAHINRNQVARLEQLLQQRDELDIEWRNLILEQNALSEHSRIESLAEKRLGMRRSRPGEEVLITLDHKGETAP